MKNTFDTATRSTSYMKFSRLVDLQKYLTQLAVTYSFVADSDYIITDMNIWYKHIEKLWENPFQLFIGVRSHGVECADNSKELYHKLSIFNSNRIYCQLIITKQKSEVSVSLTKYIYE